MSTHSSMYGTQHRRYRIWINVCLLIVHTRCSKQELKQHGNEPVAAVEVGEFIE